MTNVGPKNFRPVLAAHDGLMAEYARLTADGWNRSIGYGLIDGLKNADALRAKLREERAGMPEWMLLVFMSGQAKEWDTLKLANEEGTIAPFGAIVATKEAGVWAKLAEHKKLAFVCNVSGEMSLHRWQTGFADLYHAGRVSDIPLRHVPQFVATIDDREFRARRAPVQGSGALRPYDTARH